MSKMSEMTNKVKGLSIREISRNYAEAISNSMSLNKQSTPIRVVNENNLDKLLKTYSIEGQEATFNIACNLRNYFFELVADGCSDGYVHVLETNYLIDMGLRTHAALIHLAEALKELGGDDKAQLVYKKSDEIILFAHEIRSTFVVPPEPKGNIFKMMRKERAVYNLSKEIKSKLDQIYEQTHNASGD